MRKIMACLVLGIALSAPVVTLAKCAAFVRVGTGETAQTFFLSAEYTINGVQFCEYSEA